MISSKAILLPLLAAIVVVSGCRQGSRGADRLANDSSAVHNQQIDSNLTFDNITLNQPDAKGQMLWKVKAKRAVYSPDQKTANVTEPDGNIYQNGQPVYRVQGQQGQVFQDGEKIILTGNVLATDLKSGAVLRGDRLEWVPKTDLLTVQGNVRGSHPKVKISADMAQASNKKRVIEVTGKVVATTTDNPSLHLQTEHLVWQVDQQMIIDDRPLQVQRIQGNKTTDQANADRGMVNLATKTVTLQQNARLTLVEPPINVASNSLVWNLNQQTVVSNQPVTVVQRQQQVTATASQGRVNLQSKTAYLTGNVRAIGQRNQSQLATDRLTWDTSTQNVQADGNVVYNQADPPATVKGPRAVGKLDSKTMVVSGGDVVTEIIPKNGAGSQ